MVAPVSFLPCALGVSYGCRERLSKIVAAAERQFCTQTRFKRKHSEPGSDQTESRQRDVEFEKHAKIVQARLEAADPANVEIKGVHAVRIWVLKTVGDNVRLYEQPWSQTAVRDQLEPGVRGRVFDVGERVGAQLGRKTAAVGGRADVP